MEPTDVAGKRVTVMGLGRFGGQIAAARWLVSQGARVLVTDATPADKLGPSIEQLAALPIEYRLGEHRAEDFTSAELIVTSPAVPPSNPFLLAARAAGVPVVTEIELFLERNPARTVIGVTGTKGKSTTSALLGRMLSSLHTTHVGGNIGRPLITELRRIAPDDWVLLELSSYMLHYLGLRRFRPNVALVTMISSDHLDWHGGREGYLDAKRNLVRHQLPTDIAVLHAADPGGFAAATNARVVSYDLHSAPALPIRIPGEHNQLNAQAAFAAASALGVTWNQAATAIADFPGLPNRLELVHEQNGVRWFNDSIATIPDAAIAALDAFEPGRVVQIVGGYDKHLDMTPMCDALRLRAKSVLCIGALGPSLAEAVGSKARFCGDLSAAVSRARDMVEPGDVVLMSPGCASYDQFPNFEARGDLFRELASHRC